MTKNEKISMTVSERSGLLFIFESKDGRRFAHDGLRAFAKIINVDVNNLWRTYVRKAKSGASYWVNGKWRIVDRIDLTVSNINWKEICIKLKNCKIFKRVEKKLDALERNLVSLRLYGHFTHKVKSIVASVKSVVMIAKENWDAYTEEKKVEKNNYDRYEYKSKEDEAWLEEIKERNACALEDERMAMIF